MRVKCLAQEHNTLSPARARTRTADDMLFEWRFNAEKKALLLLPSIRLVVFLSSEENITAA